MRQPGNQRRWKAALAYWHSLRKPHELRLSGDWSVHSGQVTQSDGLFLAES